jgi:hypothetical protein
MFGGTVTVRNNGVFESVIAAPAGDATSTRSAP